MCGPTERLTKNQRWITNSNDSAWISRRDKQDAKKSREVLVVFESETYVGESADKTKTDLVQGIL